MKKIILFSVLGWYTTVSLAQVQYSSRISKKEISVLNKLEKTLKEIDFSNTQINSDTFKLNTTDSTKYARIFNTFFDTSLIKSLKNPQTYYMEKKEETNWLKNMTFYSVAGISNYTNCLPDSVFFVMPASEYNLKDKDDDRVRYTQEQLLVAGFKTMNFYYPVISILFTPSKKKIIYMNILINFEGYPKSKQEEFEKEIVPIITPCTEKSMSIISK